MRGACHVWGRSAPAWARATRTVKDCGKTGNFTQRVHPPLALFIRVGEERCDSASV